MARFPKEQVERLKQAVPLQRLAEARGIELRKVGKDLVGLCPLHAETEGSLHITPEVNLFNCFGCGKGGDNLRFLMEVEHVSFRHAVEILQRLDGSSTEAAPSKEPLKRRGTALERTEDEHKLLQQVVGLYHENLKNKPEALKYLEKRGLCHAELIAHFKVGYADRSLGYQLPKGGHSRLRQSLKKLGILRAETGHEHFSGCVLTPIFDEQGAVMGLYGRRITAAQRGAPEHLYLPGPHRGVWNREALGASPEIILCESLIDAMTFWCAGLRNVTAAYGVQGFTDEMLEASATPVCSESISPLTRTRPDRGAPRRAPSGPREGIECLRVELPAGWMPTSLRSRTRLRKRAWGGCWRRPARWVRPTARPRRGRGERLSRLSNRARR